MKKKLSRMVTPKLVDINAPRIEVQWSWPMTKPKLHFADIPTATIYKKKSNL